MQQPYDQPSFLEVFRHTPVHLGVWGWLSGGFLSLYWLNFALVDMDFVSKTLAGQTQLLDHLLGIPLILMASIYLYWLPTFLARLWVSFWRYRRVVQGLEPYISPYADLDAEDYPSLDSTTIPSESLPAQGTHQQPLEKAQIVENKPGSTH